MTSPRVRRLVIALVAAVIPLGLLSACAGSSGTTVTAQFHDAAGLFTGNDVGVLGVRVGEVTEITPRGAYVDVQLQIDDGVKVPADASAVVVSRSVATDRYVELTPVYEGGAVLASGTVISPDRTRSPVEFDALLSSLQPHLRRPRGPGQGRQAGQRLVEGAVEEPRRERRHDGEGAAGSRHRPRGHERGIRRLEGNLKNLDTLTAALAENDALVRRFTNEVADATEMLDDEHESVEQTFDALSAMVREVTKFAREHREDISTQVEDMTAVVKAMVENRRRLSQLVETFPLMLQNVDRAIDEKDRLSFRTRPLDLLPGTGAFKVLCSNFPPGTCDGLEAGAATLFDLLARLAGVRTP